MSIEGISTVTATETRSLNADAHRTVTLAEMVASRVGATLSAGGSSALTGIWSDQPASISSNWGGVTGPATSTGVTTRTQVPDVLRSYGNGRIPRELLTLIGIGQHRLYGPAARSFIEMRAAAAAAGLSLSVTDSYRTYDQQVQLAQEKGLTKNGGWAAVPGTSNHGWGLAVDVDVNAAGLAWLRANGARYGWVQPAAREPWHWEYHGPT